MLERRNFFRRALSFAAVVVAAPALLVTTGCPSTKLLVRWTTFVIGYLKDLTPILSDMGAGAIVTLIARAVPIAESLKKAFERNDQASALKWLADLTHPETGIIVEIARLVGRLDPRDTRTRVVLGVLASVQLTLRLIHAQINTEMSPAERARVEAAYGAAALAADKDPLEAAFNETRFDKQ